MKFYIVTPTFQRGRYLDETIRSVVTQSGDFDIEYCVQDGGSGDDIITSLRNWQTAIESKRFVPRCRKLTFRWFQEKDSGMYDAVNKGFKKNHGDVMAWINSDDVYHPYAFHSVSQIFSKFTDVRWIAGTPNAINQHGSNIRYDCISPIYSRRFIQKGYYDVRFKSLGLSWIPQDCCFWKKSLWEQTGSRLDDTKKYAADYFLWQKFAQYTDLVSVRSFLGCYRFHGDQITADPTLYREELPKVPPPPSRLKLLRIFRKNLPYLDRILMKSSFLKPLLEGSGLKPTDLWGPTIFWSLARSDWAYETRPVL